jgi:hypothetical protein
MNVFPVGVRLTHGGVAPPSSTPFFAADASGTINVVLHHIPQVNSYLLLQHEDRTKAYYKVIFVSHDITGVQATSRDGSTMLDASLMSTFLVLVTYDGLFNHQEA